MPFGNRNRSGCGDILGAWGESSDEHAIVTSGHVFARLDGGDHFGDAVDDREHGADQLAIGVAAAGADIGERVLGRMAERLEPGEFEEAAISLHGVDEAKNAVEPGAVVRLGLPGDDLAAQSFEHFAAFGYEIGNQIVHGS